MTPQSSRWRRRWRAFRAATWLGWQIESNWTDPLLFGIYSIVKPVAGASILVMIYALVTHADFSSPVFPWMFVGTALYLYVGALMTGISLAVIDDRERYRMLKYVFVTPTPFPLYLMARGVSRLITGSFSVWVTVLFGVLFLKLRLGAGYFNPGLFAAAMAEGVLLLTAMGVVLGSIVLTVRTHVESLGDAVAAALYLLSGAAFPLSVLPAWLQPLGLVMPVSWWLELARRSLLGPAPPRFATFSTFSDLGLLGVLSAMVVGWALAAAVAVRAASWLARERGMLDRVSNY